MVNSQATTELNWYVVYTYPHFEKKVQHSLSRANITSFLPLQKTVRQWSDRKKTVEAALFPNYIFVRTTNKERYHVLNIYGVSRYIYFDGKPVTLSEKEIEMIMKIAVEPDVTVEPGIEVGDCVSIIDGAFAGMKGVVFERKGKTRFCVRISAINQFLSFEVNSSSLKKEEPGACTCEDS